MIETDYLVVGAGAAGMAFTDAILSHSDASVTIVDRRHAPGGHWIDAYSYVRLHQPSTFYGVESVPLGADAIDVSGTNAGFYELAGADEIRAYFERVMHRHFQPTGRVRYFPNAEYVGEQRFVSRLTGAAQEVRVRRKVVDTTYIEGTIPATSPPPFAVAEGVRCVPAGGIDRLDRGAERFVVIGGGKTALDTCVYLLERGVAPAAIRWIRPRDGRWINRKFNQPYTLVPDFYRGIAIQMEAMAEAVSMKDLFARLEAAGFLLRMDRASEPAMFRGALVSEAEMRLLRQIGDVVRMGHVRSIGRDEIVLDRGRIPTSADTVHIHCAARGLARRPLRPIFEPGRITIQPMFWGFACFQFAMVGLVEAVVEGDEEKNRLCPPINYWEEDEDYLRAFLALLAGNRQRAAHPAVARWSQASRLNPVSGVAGHGSDPRVVEAGERIKRFSAAAVANLQKLLAERQAR